MTMKTYTFTEKELDEKSDRIQEDIISVLSGFDLDKLVNNENESLSYLLCEIIKENI